MASQTWHITWFNRKMNCPLSVEQQRLAMTRHKMLVRTTLVFLQVLDVLFQSFVNATWVNLTQIHALEDVFSISGDEKLVLFSHFYFCSLGYNPLPRKNRVFSPECFSDCRNEVLDLSCSLLLYCVVLATFDPLYSYTVTVCKDNLWS